MQLSFRWYGPDDPVQIKHIKQIPRMNGIVTSLKDIPIGEVWSEAALQERKQFIESYDMEWAVVESLPVHEEIKWGGPRRDELIANYQTSIRNIGRIGIPIICYNFMPICDWLRTALQDKFPDTSTGLSYYHDDLQYLDIVDVLDWNMPAWAPFNKHEIKILQEKFVSFSEEYLRANLQYFLKCIIPVAEQMGVKMAIHPDDPPWSIFGLPRIVKNKEDLKAIMSMVDSEYNGITFCTGSLGACTNNNLVEMIKYFGAMNRIHFAHIRNVQIIGKKQFREVAHAVKNKKAINIANITQAYKLIQFDGPIRPDHGRMIWDEKGALAGYGLYDRALGAMYLQGLWDANYTCV